jgi:preprotein translocase subunit SecE
MWPWGHLAVAYLCYVAWTSRRETGEQTLATLCVLAVGSQFPDLVDKPLAWTFGVLPSGRSLAHSLFTVIAIVWLVTYIGRRRDREALAVAFNVGVLTHTLSDISPSALWGIITGDWSQTEWLTYLVWPLRPPPPYANDESFLEVFAAFTVDPYVAFQFVLFGVAVWVWLATGAAGLAELRRHIQRRLGRKA